MTHNQPTVELRPANANDLAILGELLLDLYDAELPDSLRGADSQRQALLRYTLHANNFAGVRGRYVVRNQAGEIVGMAGIQFPNEPAPDRVPRGTLNMAVQLIGLKHTMHLLSTVAASMLMPAPKFNPDYAYIHGIVVRTQQRGQGYGAAIMQAVEQQLVAHKVAGAQLQVIVDNQQAAKLYERLGYRTVYRSPKWLDRVTIPNILMQKPLG
ncbi:GNAT family N-acetyltransferase [Herpetosiphon llansteffanensis]